MLGLCRLNADPKPLWQEDLAVIQTPAANHLHLYKLMLKRAVLLLSLFQHNKANLLNVTRGFV